MHLIVEIHNVFESSRPARKIDTRLVNVGQACDPQQKCTSLRDTAAVYLIRSSNLEATSAGDPSWKLFDIGKLLETSGPRAIGGGPPPAMVSLQ